MQSVTSVPRIAAVQNNAHEQPATAPDGFARMVCFHPRYRLGIQHDFEGPKDFMAALVEKTIEPKAIVDYVLAGKAEALQLQYDIEGGAWDMIAYEDNSGNWDVMETFADIQNHIPVITEALLCWLELRDLYELARRENAILPVFLLDASSPFLKTSLTAPCWSAGQIGWAYAEKRVVQKKYHGTKLQEDRLMKAEDILRAAVERQANPRHKRKGKEAAV